MLRTIVVISDRVDHGAADAPTHDPVSFDVPIASGAAPVAGSYLERLPMAAIRAGAYDRAEIWHHCARADGESVMIGEDGIVRRGFHLAEGTPPFDNRRMIARLQRTGSPGLLLVYGLGVSESVLAAAPAAKIVYNSIDAPALRVPEEVSRHFDLVLTGAPWQSDAVRARHPHTPTLVLPVGPEFAAPEQFYTTGAEKTYDLVYVAAAQPYKRHDILFDALETLGPGVSALCIFGYGELAAAYRDDAQRRGLNVDFVMPPVRSYGEVNAWLNSARIGVVAGVDDGAPAILTEYMLAGLPVLANANLTCGTQYITPQTGMLAKAADFPAAIRTMLDRLSDYQPRAEAIAMAGWQVSIPRFLAALKNAATQKSHPPTASQAAAPSHHPHMAVRAGRAATPALRGI